MVNIKKSLKNYQQSNSRVAKTKSPRARSGQQVPTADLQSSLQLQLNAFLSTNLTLGANVQQRPQLLLALSGGLDSIVLLHLLLVAQRTHGFTLSAMHVHHGLSANADSWADFCTEQCAGLKVPLQVAHIQLEAEPALGIEAAARQLRYAALFDFQLHTDAAENNHPDFVVTAHHQDDQAETLLLQLLRGAGVKGLASMAAVDTSRRLLRPLLGVSRQALQTYAELQSLVWCEDESNSNTQFERNYVRHELLPLLAVRFQGVKSVLARTASHLAEANDLLDNLAAIDGAALLEDNSLCVEGLRKLTLARGKNLLRYWFARNALAMPNSEQLQEIVQQLLNAPADANINIVLQHLSLKRFQQRAYLHCAQEVAAFDLVWNGEAEITLPNGGRLEFKQVQGAGLALKFGMTKLRISNRDGGERFKPNLLRPTRTLKHLLQEANIPPWQRLQLPLVYWHDTLAFVPGIGIAHELQAAADEAGVAISWYAPVLNSKLPESLALGAD
jgi:tRNA(Ile)-lysidine synthase